MNLKFTLPIIVIGTVTGTANFAQNTFPASARPYVPSVIGAMNLFSAILTTVAQFLKVAELMESHRVSYINYGKMSRHIRLELTLPVSERTYHGASMVESYAIQYDRLIEQSPTIPGAVFRLFNDQFKEDKNELTDPKNLQFTRPDILSIKPIIEYTILETVVDSIKNAISPPKSKRMNIKYENSKQNVIKELDALNAMGIVTAQHVEINVDESNTILTHAADLTGIDDSFEDCNLGYEVNESETNK